jgi:hypothetical protein
MENNEVRLNKIPLKRFIDALVDVYRKGADYIDIVGKADVQQDSIGIIVKESYVADEDNFRDFDDDAADSERVSKKPIDLSNPDDINQLT